MKRVLLVLAAIGVVQCFAAVGHGLTLSAGHQVDTQIFYRVLVALGVVFAIGCTKGKLGIWDAAIAIVCLGFVVVSLRHEVVEIVENGPRGGRYLIAVTALGIAAAVIGLVRATRGSCSRSPSSPASTTPR